MPLPPTRVLIAEDDPDTLQLLMDFLDQHLRHAEILAARDGAEAVQVIRAVEPDVVLSDYRMPCVNGIDALRLAHEYGATTMMITAYPDVELARQALRDGHIVRFFVKPPVPAELAASVQRVVDDLRAGHSRRAAFQRAIDAAALGD